MSQRQIHRAIGVGHLPSPLAGIVAAYAETPEAERFCDLIAQIIATGEVIELATISDEQYSITFSNKEYKDWIKIAVLEARSCWHLSKRTTSLWTTDDNIYRAIKADALTNEICMAVNLGRPAFLQTIEAHLLARIDAT